MISTLDYARGISHILDKKRLIMLKTTLEKNFVCSTSKSLKSVTDLLYAMHLV